MTSRPQPDSRDAYARFVPLTTRWMDNDAYGHLNNVVYYSLFDTAVNSLLIDAGALDIHAGAVIGLVVETHCNFFESLAFPQRIEAGVRVAQQGRSSVRYEIALYRNDDRLGAARFGHAPGIDACVRVFESAGGQLRRQFHQVKPGREVLAVSEDHRTTQFVVAFVFAEGEGQVREHGAVESVPFPGPVQTDQEQVAALFTGDATWAAIRFAHEMLLLRWVRQ